jgi:hypothetical protein
MFNREKEWVDFAEKVQKHVTDYTVPQYGDFPNDQLTGWSFSDCITSIKRYANRASTNSRGIEETKRDMLKIAHYACVALSKLES